jgi:hypothetical protein
MIAEDQPTIFNREKLASLFPPERSIAFFDALYGDADEAAFTIRLDFVNADAHRLHFQFRLEELPGKCLACNLTYGLPAVLARHPVINLQGLVSDIGQELGLPAHRLRWNLGQTITHSSDLHLIPVTITVQPE